MKTTKPRSRKATRKPVASESPLTPYDPQAAAIDEALPRHTKRIGTIASFESRQRK